MGRRSTKELRRPPASRQEKTAVGSRAFERARLTRTRVERSSQRRARSTIPSAGPWSVLRRIPRAAWVCALVACLSAICWSFVTPPFQVPDEPSHFAFVKQLADTGTLPTRSKEEFSQEENAVLEALDFETVHQAPANRTISSSAGQRTLKAKLSSAEALPKTGSPDAGVATSQPPLYYALESIPYSLGGNALERLQLMRLLSALMAGVTALFTYMFVREALPGERWAWTAGALACPFTPLLGFMSGAVNPDSMLFAVAAALFYCLARAFRRGLSMRLALATGLVIVLGLLSKLNFIGLLPGALFALAALALRSRRAHGSQGLRAPAAAFAIGLIPAVVFLAHNLVSGHSLLGLVGGEIGVTHGSIFDALSYIWQLYLPRLPGMAHDFPGLFTAKVIWFDGYVGRLGWLDTFFPGWVYTVALLAAAAIAGLCLRSLVLGRAALRSRLPELIAYVLMALGLAFIVGISSYHRFPLFSAGYGQARYMLPLLPLLGAILALAARGAGRRWGPVVGVLLVVLFLGHDIFSQLQVIARYYG